MPLFPQWKFQQFHGQRAFRCPASIGRCGYAAIDVIGHEFTHGVVFFESNLGFKNESGALNESFGDIFGFMVERYSFPGNFDWTNGEDPIPGGRRSLENPGSIAFLPLATAGLPNVYKGARWYGGTGDGGGVHINCGPQNRWFNLLAVGGTESETGVTVQGIGIDKAALITYVSMTTFIQSNSLYPDARQGAIAAATLLFGACSFEVIQTTNAWAAVGVGNLFQGSCLQITGPVHICGEPQGMPVVFKAIAPAGATITWTVPNSWGTVVSGPGNNTLTLYGIFPIPTNSSAVSISATSSMGGTTGRTIFVEVDCQHHPVKPCPATDARATNLFSNNIEGSTILTVYPNPANDALTINTSMAGSLFNINVLDIYGRKVLSSQSDNSEFLLNIEELTPGVYFLQVSSAGSQETVSFVKK